MAASKTGVKAFDDAAAAAEGTRQVAVAGATQAAAISAEITYFRTLYKNALLNGISPSNYVQALFALGVRS
jgi:hypothetical protein